MKTELLNPQNSAVIFIDFQPQMTFGVASIARQTLFNNVILLAKAARIFNVPTILTTVETKSFSGNMWPQLRDTEP
jgi:nicotinamidase-related amidase